MRKRQRDGVIGTRESAEKEAKKSLESRRSRLKYISILLISNAASGFWKWTGIGEKKGWDFLQLAITASIPVVIFLGTQYFSRKNNEKQQEIATDRYQQEALTKYFEQMSQLLLDKNLRQAESEARTIARARTLSTLRELDDIRKGLLIKFLAEAKLVSREKPVISLVDAFLIQAYLRDANLSGANLSGAELIRADLIRADLRYAKLHDARLHDARLIRADLSAANLRYARLHDARLIRADLSAANLRHVDFFGANLRDANLFAANLDDVKNLSNEQIKSTCFWEKAIYTDAEPEWNEAESQWITADEKANQKRIKEIKLDKASDPENPPDCGKWE